MQKEVGTQVVELLQKNKLRVTPSRVDILSAILSADQALSYQQISTATANKYDKVTLYRSFKTFVEKKLIHEVKSENGQTKYNGCFPSCSHDHHPDSHVHFICNSCEKIVCLYDIHVPEVSIDQKFQVSEVVLNIKGTCEECA